MAEGCKIDADLEFSRLRPARQLLVLGYNIMHIPWAMILIEMANAPTHCKRWICAHTCRKATQ